jgi:hypothetical protein
MFPRSPQHGLLNSGGRYPVLCGPLGPRRTTRLMPLTQAQNDGGGEPVARVPLPPHASPLRHHIVRVVLAGAKKQVVRVDARAVVAVVEYPQPVGADPPLQEIHHPVGLVVPILGTEPKVPVAGTGVPARPQPARPEVGHVRRDGAVLVDHCPEAFGGARAHHTGSGLARGNAPAPSRAKRPFALLEFGRPQVEDAAALGARARKGGGMGGRIGSHLGTFSTRCHAPGCYKQRGGTSIASATVILP